MKKSVSIPGARSHKAAATATRAEEPAVSYPSLGLILGGKQALGTSFSGSRDLIALTREGIQKASLYSLAAYLGITMEKMSGLLHSSHRNLQRKADNSLLDTLKTEKVLELAAFVQLGIRVLGSRGALQEWLQSPLPALGERMPLDFLDTTFGIRLLEKELGRLEAGVYS